MQEDREGEFDEQREKEKEDKAPSSPHQGGEESASDVDTEDELRRYLFEPSNGHSIVNFHKWRLFKNSFVCIQICLAGLVFEWKIQKNILTQTRLAR